MKKSPAVRKITALFACFLILSALPAVLAVDTFKYDANGNMVEDSSRGQCYEYNDAHRLKKVTNCQGVTLAEYWYDHTGRKIKAVEGDAVTYYWSDE